MIFLMLAISNAGWLVTWETLIAGGCLLFGGMALIVSIAAFGDLFAMLRDLSQEQSSRRPSDHDS
jgi:hypothetical protein